MNQQLDALNLSGVDIIPVTNEHVEHGIKQSCIACPVAYALRHYYDRIVKVRYQQSLIYNRLYKHTLDLINWIAEYDKTGKGSEVNLYVNHDKREIGIVP